MAIVKRMTKLYSEMDVTDPWYLQESNGSTPETNRSIDVLCANCFTPQDSIACFRSTLIALAGIGTALIAFARIIHLHVTSPSHLRLLLFYIMCVHCIAGSFEWLWGWTTQLSLFISYAKAIELLIICYFYLDVASKMMHWSSVAGRRLCFSALFLMFTYFTMFLVVGLVFSIEPWRDCHAPYWLWFSTGEFVMVQLMVGSFFLILHRMSRISAAPNIRNSQRRQLFCLFWTFETSALADLGYHMSLFYLADNLKGCSGVFKHDQLRYSLLKFPYDIVSFLMPVWAILYVFRATRKPNIYNNDSTESIYASRDSSVSAIADVVVVRNWRRRYRPLTQPSQHDRPVLSGRRPKQSPPTPSGRMRSVSSAPVIVGGRRLSTSRSLVSSPLYSIPEELTHNEHQGAAAMVGSIDRLSMAPLMDEPQGMNSPFVLVTIARRTTARLEIALHTSSKQARTCSHLFPRSR
ncbi:unnamed protein product [Cylicocyclus nassatus]|uniref:Uncharacterized protein n=1 Tax=Cylicocyclus nassatus TaxID=53992 RepID=A0AA36MFU4_CYLNA|nr:unnamed protein product [Cylicocyclus nassatus]